MEDLDPLRCRRLYAEAILDDLARLGIAWDGEVVHQIHRRSFYLEAWKRLRDGGWIYPCTRSRKDVASSSLAPHGEDPLFPPEWRNDPKTGLDHTSPGGVNWRFRVPDGEIIRFFDGRVGWVEKSAGTDFGDFLVWNRDDVPAYELAVVVDDAAMRITEVVRGEDLLTSTARQLLVYRALGFSPPAFFHCPLVKDAQGRRLSKRDGSQRIPTSGKEIPNRDN